MHPYDKCHVRFGDDFHRYGYDCHQKCKSGWDNHGRVEVHQVDIRMV